MNKYRFGRKFRRFRNLCAVAIALLVYGFYFIYDWIYEAKDWWKPGPMAAVFLVVGVVFEALFLLLVKSMTDSMFYRLTKKGLEFSLWGRSVCYPYADFRKAAHRFGGPFDTVPVVFTLKDKRSLEINQYVDQISELTVGLLKEIEPYAELEDGIMDFASAALKKKK